MCFSLRELSVAAQVPYFQIYIDYHTRLHISEITKRIKGRRSARKLLKEYAHLKSAIGAVIFGELIMVVGVWER